jgi:tRNA pseudouridine38-40 synthase
MTDRTFKLTIEYDGTAYFGWQRQDHPGGALPTVQGALEASLARLVGHAVRCDGAGRTDTGVHARGQVARLVTTAPHIAADGIVRGGNTLLPGDIRIVAAEEVAAAFDPRGDARLRAYRYSMVTQPVGPALGRHQLLHVRWPLDWAEAERTLALLEGEHDFSAFRSSHCTATRTRLTLRRARHVDEHPIHHLEFECRSFLHHMVRFMGGVVLEVARGKCPPETVTEMLETGRQTARFWSLPAHGLVLVRVEYGEGE